jgi:acetyl-CoA acetyltransferase
MDIEGMPTGMIVAAAHALAAGTCKYVIAVRAHYNPVDRKYSQTNAELAGGPTQFTLPYGYGPAGTRFVLWLKRYMHEYGATRESLYEIVRAARRHARLNPLAVWRDAPDLSLDAYLSARMIHDPMCLLDSDMPVTAAGAIILTTAERAKDLPHRPAYVASFANANKPMRLFESVGIKPSDVQVAQVYDGYSMLVWVALEKLGFCGAGEAHQFAAADRIGPGGSFPVNTFGGSLGEGRLHGMGHVREAVLQVMGRAGERQIRNLRYSLAHVGIPERFWTVLLSPHPSA